MWISAVSLFVTSKSCIGLRPGVINTCLQLFLGITIVKLVFSRHVFKDRLLDLKPKMSGEQISLNTCKELKALVTTKSRIIEIHTHYVRGFTTQTSNKWKTIMGKESLRY